MDLSTLAALAEAAGMEIRVEPQRTQLAGASPKIHQRLADPAWGLAWSNPEGISEKALIRAALRRGNFAVVLETCAEQGTDRMAAEWHEMTRLSAPELGQALVAQVERILRNIRQGQQQTQQHQQHASA
ncbi:MAG: hypothetical protein WEK74_05550 [Hydrogenophaga sp.]